MKNIFNLILILVLFAAQSMAQEQKYPVNIPQGQSQTLNATSFDLWVLSENQFNKALADSKELPLVKMQVEDLKSIVKLNEQKEAELVKLKETLTKDRDFYKQNWEDCSKNVEKMAKDYKRQKLIARVAVIAVPIAFVVGLII
jgi:hypothetical protein